ncbi:MAG: sigma-70 family RNA polymerase sigma factor [Ruminococcus sp.]|nr:sigma-70 family RNA polymerase sigma factor [Ruminococcus sp.]
MKEVVTMGTAVISLSDNEIIERLVTDNGGLEAAKKKYSALVMKICRGFLPNDDDAEEACADAFIRLWKTRRQINAAKSSLKTYICMLARHAAIDKTRAQDNYETVPIEENDLGIDVDYEDEAAKRINMQVIAKCISSMRSPAREIFIDRYYFGMTVNTIAQRYDLKPKKVENTLAREKKRLREALLKGGIIL